MEVARDPGPLLGDGHVRELAARRLELAVRPSEAGQGEQRERDRRDGHADRRRRRSSRPTTEPIARSGRHPGGRDPADGEALVLEPSGRPAGIEVERRAWRRAEDDLATTAIAIIATTASASERSAERRVERPAAEQADDHGREDRPAREQQHEGGRGRRAREQRERAGRP